MASPYGARRRLPGRIGRAEGRPELVRPATEGRAVEGRAAARLRAAMSKRMAPTQWIHDEHQFGFLL